MKKGRTNVQKRNRYEKKGEKSAKTGVKTGMKKDY